MFFKVLWCCFHIWRKSHLLQSLLTSFHSTVSKLIFLLQQYAVTSMENWTSTKGLSTMGDCLRQCFLGAPEAWLRERGCSQFIGHCRVHSLDQGLCTQEGKTPPDPLAYVGFHSSFKSIFVCGWMLNFCCWGEQKLEMSYAAMMLISLVFWLLTPYISLLVLELYKSTVIFCI